MAKEIERKFLVGDDAWRDDAEPGSALRQFYLAAAADRTVRVRVRNGETAVLTLKFGGGGRERDEFEYAIPLGEARELEAFAVGRIIEKTRHRVMHGGRIYEVDVFAGALAGLVLAELETPDDVAEAEFPPWLGREVTDLPAYYNASMALRGLSEASA